jgi:hypothetical protein
MSPIIFYFFIASELDPLKVDQIMVPLRTPPVVHHFLSLCRYPGVFLVGCCVVFDVWWPPKAMTYFFLLLILSIILMAKQRHGVNPTRSNPVASPLQHHYHRQRRLLVGCCVLPSTLPSKVNHPPISLIFSSINYFPPNDKQQSSPHVPTRPPLFSNVNP